jgi:EpsI family protein
MTKRAIVLVVCFVATALYLSRVAKAESTPIYRPLAELPLVLGEWQGRLEPELSQQILDILKVDDYTTRSYAGPGRSRLGFYTGYHATQRQGASIHSPLNCLPGSGWIPVDQGRITFEVPASVGGPNRVIEVNRVVIQKGLDRQLVLYWYQSQGRVIASEYWGKVYSVVDSIRLNRSDAALVRVVVPIGSRDSDARLAERDGIDFTRVLFPHLAEHLPS